MTEATQSRLRALHPAPHPHDPHGSSSSPSDGGSGRLGGERRFARLTGKLPSSDDSPVGFDHDDYTRSTFLGNVLGVSHRQVLAQEAVCLRVADEVDDPAGKARTLHTKDVRLVGSTGRGWTCCTWCHWIHLVPPNLAIAPIGKQSARQSSREAPRPREQLHALRETVPHSVKVGGGRLPRRPAVLRRELRHASDLTSFLRATAVHGWPRSC